MRLILLASLALAAAALAGCDSSEPLAVEPGAQISTSYFPLFDSDFGPAGRTRTATFPMAAITDEVNSRGLVLAEIDRQGGESAWTAMPLTVIQDTVVVHFGYSHRTGEVSVSYASTSSQSARTSRSRPVTTSSPAPSATSTRSSGRRRLRASRACAPA